MRTQAYEGYFENGNFFASGRVVRLPERKRVVITVLDEPAKIKSEMSSGEKERRLAWLKKLDELTIAARDEELIYIPRSKKMRPPLDLAE